MNNTMTYYVVTDVDGQPATAAQKIKLGKPGYGYKTMGLAVRYCPPNSFVEERHTDGATDWAGRLLGYTDSDGAFQDYGWAL